MNTGHDKVTSSVEALLKQSFPNVIVRFRPAVDDESTVCVRVFGAQNDEVGGIKKLIRTAGRALGNDVLLLPMVKTMDVTREYYPAIYQELGMHRLARSIQSVVERWERSARIASVADGQWAALVARAASAVGKWHGLYTAPAVVLNPTMDAEQPTGSGEAEPALDYALAA